MIEHQKAFLCIQSDLLASSNDEWQALEYIINHKGTTIAAIKIACGAHESGCQTTNVIDPFLRMGVVNESLSGNFFIASDVIHQVILKVWPTRSIVQVAESGDPHELLFLALHYINPVVITHKFSQNRTSPSESNFHYELYSSIRELLKSTKLKLNVFSEADDTKQGNVDILILNGVRHGYELKVNQLLVADIKKATEQANRY